MISALKQLVEMAAEKGTMLKEDGYLIGITGDAFNDEIVTFTREHANAVINHLETPAMVQEIHHAVSVSTKGHNLETLANSAQEGRALRLNDITYPIAESNKMVKNVLHNVPTEMVPYKVMRGVQQEWERSHNLDGVLMEHIGKAAAQSRDTVRKAVKDLPEGEAFLDSWQDAIRPSKSSPTSTGR